MSEIAFERKVIEVAWSFSLTAEQADSLYNELYRVFDRLGVALARDRATMDLPSLYALYDGLYKAGVMGDGSGHDFA